MRDEERNPKTAAGVTPGTAALEHEVHDANRDPVTGEPGAHPVGTGVGAASGGTVGAVIGGAVGGPLGAMVGAAVGGIAGGLAGKGISESVNPTEEDAFWRDHYSTRPYASGRSYDQLQPAYRHGWEARTRYEDRNWNDVEGDLERDWTQRHGS
jgi:phage tail tape-measure protein